MPYHPDLKVLTDNFDAILLGLRMTLIISSLGMVSALIVGLIVALMRISDVKILSRIAAFYIQFFRGIPQYVFIVWLYYGLAMLTGIDFKPIQAGLLALTLQYAGFLAETYRAGIQAVGKGQTESAMSVGLSKRQTFQYIVLPQAVRIIIPAAGNSFIGMLKDSSLVSVIGVTELMRSTQIKASLYFRPFEFLTAAALIYVGLTFVFSFFVQRVEQRMQY